MPAYDYEVKEAEKEGIEFIFLAAPTRLIGENGRVTALEYLQMSLAEPDETGRRRPIPIEGSETIIEVDQVIPAIGQTPEPEFLTGLALEFDGRGRIATPGPDPGHIKAKSLCGRGLYPGSGELSSRPWPMGERQPSRFEAIWSMADLERSNCRKGLWIRP